LDEDEAFGLLCSFAASGEAQGGWENARIAALLPMSMRDLAPKVTRHGADEDKHGRIFTALLRKRGLTPCEVPPETDYTMLLERRGIGLRHQQLRGDEPLAENDVIAYLAHSRVTEQRAAEQMAMLRRHFGDHPELGKAVAIIAADEDNHLAYCHEELLRLSADGHAEAIRRILVESARAEIRVYKGVTLAVTREMGRILGWSRGKLTVMTAGIHALHLYERVFGWRRMVSLRMPERRDAMGGRPAAPAARHA
jgi:hypothetical protein